MSKRTKILTILISLFIFTNTVNANTCDSEDLKDYRAEAENIKINYKAMVEEVEGHSDGNTIVVDKHYIQINIYNITENLEVVVNNTTKDNTDVLRFSDSEEGVIAIDVMDVSEIQNYEFTIKTIDPDCSDENLKSTKLTIPKYNREWDSDVCLENPDFYLCQKYINTDKTYNEIVNEIEEYEKEIIEEENEGNNETIIDQAISFIDKNLIIITVILFVIIAAGAFVVIKRKKRVL